MLHFRNHFSKSSTGCCTSGITFQKAALDAALPESLFKKQRWMLHFRSHFSKSSAGSCTSGVTFQKALLEAALPESLFKKQRWKLHFRSHFSKSTARSCTSGVTFQKAALEVCVSGAKTVEKSSRVICWSFSRVRCFTPFSRRACAITKSS